MGKGSPSGVPYKTTTPSGGKLAFSLKLKSKLVAPSVKLDEDEVRDTGNALGPGEVATKRLKLGHPYSCSQSSPRVDVGETVAPPGTSPIAVMEDYRENAEQEERKRPLKQSHDEMPPPSSLQVLRKRGHHKEDDILQEELGMSLAIFNDYAQEAADRARIQGGIVGHKQVSEMGWREAPHSPSDPKVKNVADKLASFVAKYRRVFEHISQQKNYGNSRDTPFKFLFDESCPDYKYYEYRLHEEKVLAEANVYQALKSGGESVDLFGTDPIAKWEYYREKGEHEERNRLHKQSHDEKPPPSSLQAPHSPCDPEVKNVADKLASFVAKHGRCFEHVTRPKNFGNSGDTPFKFLFDESCADYKYYECRLHEEEKTPVEANVYQTWESGGESVAASGTGSVDMMKYHCSKLTEQEKRKKPRKQSHDEMPPPSSLQVLGKRCHGMDDYNPQEKLDEFLATSNDPSAQKASKEAADRARIQADNIGHKILPKMGWREGEDLGSSKEGRSDPIMAGDVKAFNLGIGARNPGEESPEVDIYERYKKSMLPRLKKQQSFCKPSPSENI